MTTTAHEAGMAAVGEHDPAHAARWIRELDLAVLTGIRALLASAPTPLPADPAGLVTAADRHRWIAGHWVRALAEEGFADVTDGVVTRLARPRRAELVAARATVPAATAALGYPPALADYILGSLRALPALLRDEVSAQSLLFADGRDTAAAAYRDNPVNRYLNAAATRIVAAMTGPLRVLELGAGTGATTADLLDVLAPGSDYLFTDLSPMFLREAAERFAGHPGLHFGILDFTRPLREQGVAGGLDLVVAVNTAHNALDVPALLQEIAGLLAPGGALLLIETCHEHHQSLASMPFLLSPRPGEDPLARNDSRAGTTRTYLTSAEWHAAAASAGLRGVVDLPDHDHPLAAYSQRLSVFTR